MKTNKAYSNTTKAPQHRTAVAKTPEVKIFYLWGKDGIQRVEFFTGNKH